MRFPLVVACALAAACGPPRSAERTVSDLRDISSERSGGSGGSRGPGGRAANPTGSQNGRPCQHDSDCRSDSCVDGLCCDSDCEGACLACDQSGSPGKCVPVAAGQDPDEECEEAPMDTCGQDGVCDGKGACRKYAAGTMCALGGCAEATQREGSTCDGAGTCKPGPTRSCAPAVCVGETCGDPCTGHADCPTGFFCDDTTCRSKLANAEKCTVNEQCGSGFCVDGVCCATECADTCYACDQAGSEGTCTAIADGHDPKNDCPIEAAITCGRFGGCNGRGACRFHTAGTPCGPASCEGFTSFGAKSCDGMGTCKTGPATDCEPYICNGPICWNACANDEQCKSGFRCNINRCEAR